MLKKLYLTKNRLFILSGLLLALGWLFFNRNFPYALDAAFHLRFSKVFFEAALEKGGYPDWDAPTFLGRGCASFRYYAPLTYLLTGFFQFCGASCWFSIKLVLLFFLLTAIFGIKRWFRVMGLSEFSTSGIAIFLTSPILTIFLYRVMFFQNICAFLLIPLFLSFLFEEEGIPTNPALETPLEDDFSRNAIPGEDRNNTPEQEQNTSYEPNQSTRAKRNRNIRAERKRDLSNSSLLEELLHHLRILSKGVSNFVSSNYKTILNAGIVFCGICLSHLLAALMVVYLGLVISIVTLIIERKPKFLIKFSLSILSGIGLGAFYILPAFFTTGETHMGLIEWSKWHFIKTTGQLPGFINSISGTNFFAALKHNSTQSVTSLFYFSIGCSVLAFLTTCCPLYIKEVLQSQKKTQLILFISSLFFLFLSLSPSLVLWEILPKMLLVQYPYRWTFPILILFLPIFSTNLQNGLSQMFNIFVKILLLLFFIAPALILQFTSPFLNDQLTQQSVNDSTYYPIEYLPKTYLVEKELDGKSGVFHQISCNDKEAKIEIIEKKQELAIFQINAKKTDSKVLIQTHFDDYWTLENQSDKSLIKLDNNGNENLILFVPLLGEHVYKLFRRAPNWRWEGLLISLFSVFAVFRILKKKQITT
ncbi:MAG: hypothetical protein HQM08_07080 [Candidatus Riflebacteria bacterium]|nr:hypothetical protein [Candidatus Riflebacteria bacterium]